MPIVCPVGLDDNFETYNINADDAACAIARAMEAEKLAFLTDIEGVYKDPKDPKTLISELTVEQAETLMKEATSAEACFQSCKTVLMRLRTVYPECIFWTAESRIVCCWKSLQTKGLELRF